MRKVVLYELLSLDGVAERPDEFVLDFDPVMQENLGRVVSSQDAVLLGRRTFDDWAEYWPTGDNELFASFINGGAEVCGHLLCPAGVDERIRRGRRAQRVC